jgi:hypothetical protein
MVKASRVADALGRLSCWRAAHGSIMMNLGLLFLLPASYVPHIYFLDKEQPAPKIMII